MAGKLKLDDVDRKILRDLQDDGRITNVELAKRSGISAPPCLRRVRALEGELQDARGRARAWATSGSLVLTDVRLVFVAGKASREGLRAFDFPLQYVRGERFNQPIFGANNLSGECFRVETHYSIAIVDGSAKIVVTSGVRWLKSTWWKSPNLEL